MRYLLDTNICIYIARRKPAAALARLERVRPGEVGMSVVTWLELAYGASKSRYAETALAAIEELRRLIPVLPLAAEAAGPYGRLCAELEGKGTPIGPYDLLIAAHALSLDLVLVTNNVREFARVRGLRIENWAE